MPPYFIYSSTSAFFFFSFLADLQHMKCPGQGSDRSHSCDVSRSFSNAGSLTYCAAAGDPTYVPALPRLPQSLCTTAGTLTSAFFAKYSLLIFFLFYYWHQQICTVEVQIVSFCPRSLWEVRKEMGWGTGCRSLSQDRPRELCPKNPA